MGLEHLPQRRAIRRWCRSTPKYWNLRGDVPDGPHRLPSCLGQSESAVRQLAILTPRRERDATEGSLAFPMIDVNFQCSVRRTRCLAIGIFRRWGSLPPSMTTIRPEYPGCRAVMCEDIAALCIRTQLLCPDTQACPTRNFKHTSIHGFSLATPLESRLQPGPAWSGTFERLTAW